MLWGNLGPTIVHLMETPIIQAGETTQIFLGNQGHLHTNHKAKPKPLNKPLRVHEVETQDGESSNLREVKAVITLRSGKEVDQPLPNVGPDEELRSKRSLIK